MNILLAGGAGYIGSHAVKQLLENGDEVAVIDSLQTGHIASVPSHIPFYNVDITNKAEMEKVFQKHKY